jgi:hypothetical protein
MKDLTQALRDIAGIFESLGASYAVMGGAAVRIHGIPRPTHDVDFTVALPRARLQEFFDCAVSAGYAIPEEYFRGWVDQVAGMPLVKVRMYLQDHGIDVDIFLAESEFQGSLLARRRREEFEGGHIWFVSPEDLILLKLIAGRPRDLLDVQDVFFVQGQVDESYLRRWAAALSVTDRLEAALRDREDPQTGAN